MAQPGQDTDPTDLHGLAVDALTDIEKLATGLAHAGAAPEAVQTLSKMSEVLQQVVKVLGESGPTAGGPPPGHQPGQPGGAPQQAAPQQAAPQQEQAPQQGAPPSGQQAVQQHSILSATHALHAAAQASAQRRQQPQQP